MPLRLLINMLHFVMNETQSMTLVDKSELTEMRFNVRTEWKLNAD